MSKRTKIIVMVVCLMVICLLSLPLVVGFLNNLTIGEVIDEGSRFPSSAELSDDKSFMSQPEEGFVPNERRQKKLQKQYGYHFLAINPITSLL